MSEREPRDLMSVDSFSQLPFIRSAPSDTKPCSRPNQSLRLFGIDFPSEETTTSDITNTSTTPAGGGSSSNAGGGESGRKFECHYCCRNFPTSQALGGHQNAHKRERQHAKRAHLQSAAAMAAHHHYQQHQLISPAADSHVYGSLLNYHRMGSVPSSARFPVFDPPPPPPHYPLWNGTTTSPGTTAGTSGNAVGGRFYCGLGSVSQPINGSPVAPGMWGVPGVIHRHRPMFGDGSTVMAAGEGGGVVAPFSSSSTQGSASGHELGAKDSVSLDLHL